MTGRTARGRLRQLTLAMMQGSSSQESEEATGWWTKQCGHGDVTVLDLFPHYFLSEKGQTGAM